MIACKRIFGAPITQVEHVVLKRRERRALAIVLSSSGKPSHLPHCQREVPLCRILFASVRRQIFGDLLWHSQFHSNQFAHAALFHCHSVRTFALAIVRLMWVVIMKLPCFTKPSKTRIKAVMLASSIVAFTSWR